MRRLSKPSPSMIVSLVALTASLGGTSYAAVQITSKDVKNESLTGADIKNSSLTGAEIKNGSLRAADFGPNSLPKGAKGDTGAQGAAGPAGPAGPAGAAGAKGADGITGPTGAAGTNGADGEDGADGAQGPAGTGRWVLVDATGAIEAQSGGFTVAQAYTATPPGASENVYINAGEPLGNNAIVASVALQNQVDQNGDTIMNGKAAGADSNPEFSGEISATMCAITGVVSCAPTGTNTTSHFVVSPRLSDGSPTSSTTRKRFYVIISGDSTDLVAR